ncbi:MAG TPA: class I SAM-dependent methyltransferase [Candidatus Nanoarchaeia archaeon]|nr:class I SAM-dependent methyltransferase [Candidatus Nanoarchaeia archaeon]
MIIINQLKSLEQESIARRIPIIGSAKGTWLLQQVQKYKPKKILELGTANGYSGCILGSEGAEVTTIDIDGHITEEAKRNYALFNIKATIIIQDGVEAVKDMAAVRKDYFDMIFIDFHKTGYFQVLEDCLRLLKPKGIMIADNITFPGCQDFRQAVLTDPRLETIIIDIRDGLSFSQKK